MNRRTAILTGIFSGLTLILVSISMPGIPMDARILDKPQNPVRWQSITEEEVGSGVTIQDRANVFFHVPQIVDSIDRELLLGRRGQTVRYWGYCFPGPEDDERNLPQTTGFPGKLFLSEAERAWRTAQARRQFRVNPFTPPDIIRQHASAPEPAPSPIRHQLDTFRGGMTCFITSDGTLPMGIDEDDDGLNSKMESEYLTDPLNPDTDDDGLLDYSEVRYHSDPIRRDTDGDGIVDGIEDANHNGRFELGETSPVKRDTDGDTMCDGLCSEMVNKEICKDNKGQNCSDLDYGHQMGEDKNLNGKVDSGESDPRKKDSVGDGVRDDQRFYKCLLGGGKNC